ncbi:MAG: hypothetical protein M1816_003108 [Peltula sp. TS41687]|nr:MAG: hypothetical protein M1816_003108 [Peltula sp. TS41687]
MIPIQQHDLPDDRDLLYEPTNQSDGVAVYAHIVDCHMATAYARNLSQNTAWNHHRIRSRCLLRRTSGYSTTRSYATVTEGCYDHTRCIHHGYRDHPTRGYERFLQGDKDGQWGHDLRSKEDYDNFAAVITEFEGLFDDTGNDVVEIPKHQWMEIPLLDNWRDIYKPCKARVYPLGPKDRHDPTNPQTSDARATRSESRGLMELAQNTTETPGTPSQDTSEPRNAPGGYDVAKSRPNGLEHPKNPKHLRAHSHPSATVIQTLTLTHLHSVVPPIVGPKLASVNWPNGLGRRLMASEVTREK